jgi:uncharacterized membrane protein
LTVSLILGAVWLAPVRVNAEGMQIPCYEIAAVIQGPAAPPFGSPDTFGTAISPNGEYVVGFYNYLAGSDDRGWVYHTLTGQFSDLPKPPGISVMFVADVNDAGLAVGRMGGSAGGFAFVFDLNTNQFVAQIQAVVTTGGNGAGFAAINSQGAACGTRTISLNPTLDSAFTWSAKDGITDLGVMIEPGSVDLDLNAAGVIVGYAGLVATSAMHGFVHENGRTTILPPIPGGLWSQVRRINDRNTTLVGGTLQIQPQIVVQTYLVDGEAWTLLPALPGYLNTASGGLSNYGTVVGRSRNLIPLDVSRATLWRAGQPIDLNQFLPADSNLVLEYGKAISDNGSIVVDSINSAFQNLVVLMRPVSPAPGDTDCNTRVDMDDLLHVITAWGPCLGCSADLNGDHSVNVEDLMLVITNWDFDR